MGGVLTLSFLTTLPLYTFISGRTLTLCCCEGFAGVCTFVCVHLDLPGDVGNNGELVWEGEGLFGITN